MSATTGSFSIGDTTVTMPVKTGSIGPSVVDIGKLYASTGMFTYDPDLPRRRAVNRRLPISTATKVCCSIAVIRSIRSPNKATFSKPLICCSTGNCRPQRRKRISTTGSPAIRWCTSRWPGFSKAFAGTPIRWPFCVRALALCRPFITIRPIFRIRSSAWSHRSA